MAVVMVENFDGIPANSPVPGEYLIVYVLTLKFNDVTVDEWKNLCPRYDSLTPDQL